MKINGHKIAHKIQNRFKKVYTSNYPRFLHLINLALGILCGTTFALFFPGPIGTKIGLFFVITLMSYLLILAFTYGLVRSRKAWKK